MLVLAVLRPSLDLMQQAHRFSRNALTASGKAKLLGRRRLHIDLRRVHTNIGGDVGYHRGDLRCLARRGGVG